MEAPLAMTAAFACSRPASAQFHVAMRACFAADVTKTSGPGLRDAKNTILHEKVRRREARGRLAVRLAGRGLRRRLACGDHHAAVQLPRPAVGTRRQSLLRHAVLPRNMVTVRCCRRWPGVTVGMPRNNVPSKVQHKRSTPCFA